MSELEKINKTKQDFYGSYVYTAQFGENVGQNNNCNTKKSMREGLSISPIYIYVH